MFVAMAAAAVAPPPGIPPLCASSKILNISTLATPESSERQNTYDMTRTSSLWAAGQRASGMAVSDSVIIRKPARLVRQCRLFSAAGLWISLVLVQATDGAWARVPQGARGADSGEITLSVDAAQSSLHWVLRSTLHTVHGTFAMKRGSMHFDSTNGNASGEFVADATSGKSGNEGRDGRMHREILESARYSEVIFRPGHVEGKVAWQGTSHVQLQGKMLLHGSEHEMTVPVEAEIDGDHWKGAARFTVPYVQWGLKSPNTLLLKADPTVEIELKLSGTVQAATAQ